MNRKFIHLTIVFSALYASSAYADSFAKSAVMQENGSSLFLILFVVTLLALIGLSIWGLSDDGRKEKRAEFA